MQVVTFCLENCWLSSSICGWTLIALSFLHSSLSFISFGVINLSQSTSTRLNALSNLALDSPSLLPLPLPGISIPRAACQTPQPPEIPLNFPTWLGTPGKNVSIKNAFTLFYNAKVIVSAIKREKNHFHTKHQVDFNNYFLAVKTCSKKA